MICIKKLTEFFFRHPEMVGITSLQGQFTLKVRPAIIKCRSIRLFVVTLGSIPNDPTL